MTFRSQMLGVAAELFANYLHNKRHGANSVGIIGGSNGPTAIFLKSPTKRRGNRKAARQSKKRGGIHPGVLVVLGGITAAAGIIAIARRTLRDI